MISIFVLSTFDLIGTTKGILLKNVNLIKIRKRF